MDDVIPDWATRIVLIRRDDDWRCELTGDPRGTGNVHTTAGAGPTAQGALDYVMDIAEGWRSFTLGRPEEGDDGGE